MPDDSSKRELPKSYEPAAIEARWAEYWVNENLFAVPTPVPGETRPVFSLLLPPPNVTGSLHMGHMFEQTQMDIMVRWHRMRGFRTLWLPGTDHAGIATQLMVERQLASEGNKRADLGREKFVERVWEWKRHYGGRIQEQMKRLGASVDWSREYFTMDENLSRAVREVFVRLHEEGLIYRAKYIVNWCPRCGTAISDLEVKHEEITGKLWEIRYPVIGTNEFITVATTRPETMLGDTAVAVNERDERYKHLHGKRVLLPLMNREIPIITDDLAQPEFGTGAVKVTPAHDPNDFQAGLRHNLPQIGVMDETARMNANAGPYAGLDRYEARKRVLADLGAGNFLVGEKDHVLSLGKCDRCGTVVEPRLSTQWFIKIKPMADRAAQAVESGEITIAPENFRTIYLNWMANIHDWCISRQLWWGHRIPAWHCSCGEIIVVREAPAKCTKCGGSELKQDSDVLDTWFSSGLLPFTTLGWPEKTRDLEVFYPNQMMITGFDILFFWLARMIMFGCHFMQGHAQDAAVKQASGNGEAKDDSVPFRHVYIHMLVRDADRQKMSKTKGNVVDPLDVIARFGTDATRFTLAAMAAPGTDVAFNESRTEGYRNFANKIWNAARFMFMHRERIGREHPGVASLIDQSYVEMPGSQSQPRRRPYDLHFEDAWIKSRINSAVKDINKALRTYRFDEAANRVYDFFWGEFCDWYIELIKPRLTSDQANIAGEACENLITIFEASLRLVHPIMPFITEEIWQAMIKEKAGLKSIAMAPYPQLDESHMNSEIERRMLVLQDLVASVRNLRAELKVEPKQQVPIEVFTEETAVRSLIEQNYGAIARLGSVEEVRFASGSLAKLPNTRHTASFDLRLIYEKQIDVVAEREKLTKELDKLEKEKGNSERQLANAQFVAKAPAHVVEKLRNRKTELEALIGKLNSKLKELG